MKTIFKHQHSQYSAISLLFLILASEMGEHSWCIYLLHIVAVLWAWGFFLYQIYKQPKIELYNILGVVFPTLYSIGFFCTPLFEIILYVFFGVLFVSMLVCMYQCKEEDAKAISLLHMMYMTSCLLAIPKGLVV